MNTIEEARIKLFGDPEFDDFEEIIYAKGCFHEIQENVGVDQPDQDGAEEEK